MILAWQETLPCLGYDCKALLKSVLTQQGSHFHVQLQNKDCSTSKMFLIQISLYKYEGPLESLVREPYGQLLLLNFGSLLSYKTELNLWTYAKREGKKERDFKSVYNETQFQ